jgi:hypothetical protein
MGEVRFQQHAHPPRAYDSSCWLPRADGARGGAEARPRAQRRDSGSTGRARKGRRRGKSAKGGLPRTGRRGAAPAPAAAVDLLRGGHVPRRGSSCGRSSAGMEMEPEGWGRRWSRRDLDPPGLAGSPARLQSAAGHRPLRRGVGEPRRRREKGGGAVHGEARGRIFWIWRRPLPPPAGGPGSALCRRGPTSTGKKEGDGGMEEGGWGPQVVGMGEAPRPPENAALTPACCILQHLLRLLLEPLQCTSDLHFADAAAYAASAGDSLTSKAEFCIF